MVVTTAEVGGCLRSELARLVERLGRLLRRQRERGRTPAVDAVGGLVIEEGEVEGLHAEVSGSLNGPCPSPKGPPRVPAGSGSAALRRAATVFDLSSTEYDALLLALGVELDARLARLVAYLNDHAAQVRPTVGLALALAELEDGSSPWPVAWLVRPILRDGLLELEGDGPLSCRPIRLAPAMLARLADEDAEAAPEPGLRFRPIATGLLDRLLLDEGARERLASWAGGLRERFGSAAPLVLAGAEGSGRRTAARAAVAVAGLPLVASDVEPDRLAECLRAARREARWHEAALLVRVPRAAAPTVAWPALWAGLEGLGRPLVLVVPEEVIEDVASAAPAEPPVVVLDEPGVDRRARLWRTLLPPATPMEDRALDELAARFRFGPGRIARALRRAEADRAIETPGERRLTPEGLARACRAVGAAAMGPLAQKLPLPYTRADLIVAERIHAELDLAVAWVRNRRQVLDRWGFGRRLALGRGLAALFSGPPGTGKTMAAQVLARELDLDLYRVDLSRVMSKYIGETEKNLARLFDEADASGAVLFFDEADALFGKRSEVRDAHDRYANVEVGYLLQRIESYDGVAVLATNRRGDLDEAFLRRFHVVADFPLPDEQERLRIWQGALPAESEREPGLELARLARPFEVSGGEIRNASLAAAYLASDEGRPIGLHHLARALAREMAKNGRVVDDPLLRELAAAKL